MTKKMTSTVIITSETQAGPRFLSFIVQFERGFRQTLLVLSPHFYRV